MLKAALGEWKDRIKQVIAEHPTWDEEQIAQQVYEEVGVRGSKVLLPVFEAAEGPARPALHPDQSRSGTGTPTGW